MSTPYRDPASTLADCLPEVELRELAKLFEMAKLVDKKEMARRAEFFTLVRGANQSYDTFLKRETPPALLVDLLSRLIIERDDFRNHVRKRGDGRRMLTDGTELGRLGRAAAGTIVAEYLWENSNGSS
jgi:hypothetical protein